MARSRSEYTHAGPIKLAHYTCRENTDSERGAELSKEKRIGGHARSSTWHFIPAGRCIALAHCPCLSDRQHYCLIPRRGIRFQPELHPRYHMIFEAHHADYLVRLLGEILSNDELATRMSKQFRVRITAGQVGALLTRMRRPTDAIYRAVPYRRAGSRFGG